MNVHFSFTSTTRFDQLKTGDVFLSAGKYAYMKIEPVVQPDMPWYGGDIVDIDCNAISLSSQPGQPKWFDNDELVFPCPNASISF